jgi:hypothetical protein
MIVSNGVVTVSSLIVSNSTDGFAFFTNSLTLVGGTINSAATTISNGQQFAIGDGVSSATYHLLGGVHSFGGGLRVRNNATLSGCGTINGVFIVDPGGTVVADCGGTLTFRNSGTVNGIMHAENGSVLETFGAVDNNGVIDVMDGTTHGLFINNTGTTVDAGYFRVTSITRQGNDINLIWTTVGGRS